MHENTWWCIVDFGLDSVQLLRQLSWAGVLLQHGIGLPAFECTLVDVGGSLGCGQVALGEPSGLAPSAAEERDSLCCWAFVLKLLN